jgi:hypothetical protein
MHAFSVLERFAVCIRMNERERERERVFFSTALAIKHCFTFIIASAQHYLTMSTNLVLIL